MAKGPILSRAVPTAQVTVSNNVTDINMLHVLLPSVYCSNCFTGHTTAVYFSYFATAGKLLFVLLYYPYFNYCKRYSAEYIHAEYIKIFQSVQMHVREGELTNTVSSEFFPLFNK